MKRIFCVAVLATAFVGCSIGSDADSGAGPPEADATTNNTSTEPHDEASHEH